MQGLQRLRWYWVLPEVSTIALRRSWRVSRPKRALWEDARMACFERDGHRCVKCGEAGRLEADHIKPLFRGGDVYDLANLRTLCRRCHIDRHRRPVDPGWKRLVNELLTGTKRSSEQ